MNLRKRFAASLGVRHRILATEEITRDEFSRNAPDRCYHCKQELFGKLRQIADAEGIAYILDGTNIDDLSDHRPGRKAAGEFSVRSPLAEARLTKQEVRALARSMDLPMWDKPSLACLSSRIPYGTPSTLELLKNIQAAEDAIHALGIRQVRVRHHGDTARIEVEQDDLAQSKKLTFEKLSRLTGLSTTTLSSIEKGKSNVRLSTARRIIRVLGKSIRLIDLLYPSRRKAA